MQFMKETTLPIMLGLVAISYIWGIAERKTHEQKI